MEILEKCPVCYSEDHHIYFSVIDEPEKSFHLCNNCGCCFKVERLTDQENIDWYRSGDYRKRTAKVAALEDEMRHQQMRAENIASLVNDRVITSHLDIGCSAGALLREVQKAHPGITSVGVDIDPEFTQYAVGLFILPSIDNVTGLFDLITIIHTLEHINEPQPFLAKVVQHLSPGGILIIEVPNRRAWMVAYAAPEHIIAYEKQSLYYLMNKSGLKVGATLFQGFIQGSPLDLNIIIMATNDPEKLIPKRELPDEHKPLKVFVHVEGAREKKKKPK
jgi:SAM-dependent methyltransferase